MRWGSQFRADSLSNIPLNARGLSVSFSFEAARSEPILGIRLTSPLRPGYTVGNGGDIQVTVVGESVPFYRTAYLFENTSDPYAPLLFSTLTPSLVEGAIYTVTVQNVADDPVNNWRSVDGLVVTAVDPLDAPNSLLLNNAPHPTNFPMWEVLYVSSTSSLPESQGLGYVDVANGAEVNANNVRQVLIPSLDRVVTGGAISLRGQSVAGLVSLAGVTATLYAPAVPNGWSPFYFQAPVTLHAGSTNYLTVSVPSTVTAVPLQKGWHRASDGVTKLYDYGPNTFFGEGNGQQLVNGAWSDWISEQGAADPRLDLMFWLNIL